MPFRRILSESAESARSEKYFLGWEGLGVIIDIGIRTIVGEGSGMPSVITACRCGISVKFKLITSFLRVIILPVIFSSYLNDITSGAQKMLKRARDLWILFAEQGEERRSEDV